MHLSRVVVRNFRNLRKLDIQLDNGPNCFVGENNSGKSNLVHAIRLVLDQTLPNYARSLDLDDIHPDASLATGDQVVIAIEFRNYSKDVEEQALVGAWEVEPDRARLTYRFRPRLDAIGELDKDGKPTTALTIADYAWELRGSGDIDPTEISWNESTGSQCRPGELQAFHVTFLTPLRDVQRDLRNFRVSPLNRVIEAIQIPDAEKEKLIDALAAANNQIATSPTITSVGDKLEESFKGATGPASALGLKLGIAEASFATIARSLRLLLSDASMADFDPAKNGLGLNNILYISLLLQYFETAASLPSNAGQLLIVEEPEAHLHPQLQRTLYDVLARKPFQTLLTTHSTHVTSKAPLRSISALTRTTPSSVSVANPAADSGLEPQKIQDLERYLDATRSTLLFARK